MATVNLNLDLLVQNQSGAEVIFNTLATIMDAFLPLRFVNQTTTTPPGSPAAGDTYLVATSATGAWSGKDGKIAVYFGGWIFITPKAGTIAFDIAQNKWYTFKSSTWTQQSW